MLDYYALSLRFCVTARSSDTLGFLVGLWLGFLLGFWLGLPGGF
jgi:hypothetical protein